MRRVILGLLLMVCLFTTLLNAAGERVSVSLAGAWHAAVETDEAAARVVWPAELPDDAIKVILPGRLAATGAVWYARDFVIPGSGVVTGQLCLDHPVGRLTVFLNGTELAQVAGIGLPVRLPFSGVAGETAHLALRLTPVPGLRTDDLGLGPLRVEMPPATRIETLHAVLDPTAKLLQVRYHLVTASPLDAVLRLDVYSPEGGRPLTRAQVPLPLPVGDTDGEQRLVLKNVQFWSPTQPKNSYRLVATLLVAGQTLDERTLRCGAAHPDIAGGTLRLNGTPLQLRGARLPGRFPSEANCPPSQAFTRELRLLKQASFNAILIDGPAPSELLLDTADALGLLVIIEAPRNAGRTALREVVEACGHHPCIIAWSTTDTEEADLLAVQAADANRLLFQRDGADSLLRAAGREPLRCADLDTVAVAADPAAWWQAFSRLETQHLPLLASDVYAVPGPGEDAQAALNLLRDQVESLRATRELSLLGYFVRLPESETLTGLCTLTSVPTGAFVSAIAFNQSRVLTLRAKHTAAPGERPIAGVALLNDQRLAGPYLLYLVVTAVAEGKTTITEHPVTLTGRALTDDLATGLTFAPTQPGDYRLQVLLTRGTDVIAVSQVVQVTVKAPTGG